jgi:hypothetical protein
LNPKPESQEAGDLASRLGAKRDELADKVSEDRAREASMARVALKAKEIAKRMGLLAQGADQVSHSGVVLYVISALDNFSRYRRKTGFQDLFLTADCPGSRRLRIDS